MQAVSRNICERMGLSQELSEFQVELWSDDTWKTKSWNFLSPKYSTVNCQLDYQEMEVFGNDSNSAMKW